MKNIHLLPTDKPNRLHKIGDEWGLTNEVNNNPFTIQQNIYITSDEKIKEGDWMIRGNEQPTLVTPNFFWDFGVRYYKIILTTDQELIKDGVQAIDDEFLEWFIKNPSCEFVEVSYGLLKPFKSTEKGYMIHLPDNEVLGEPKQETLEETGKEKRAELFNSVFSIVNQIPRKDVDGDAMDASSCAYEIEQLFYKWQAERMYSEDDLRNAYRWGTTVNQGTKEHFNEWFEQFKKK